MSEMNNFEMAKIQTLIMKKFFRNLGEDLTWFILSPNFFNEMDIIQQRLQMNIPHQIIW